MWFAKNSDRHPDEIQVLESHGRRSAGGELRTQYLTIPDPGAAAFVGSRPTWLWGCEHGVNEYGVAAGNEKIYTTTNPNRLPPALLGMDIVRLVLERARTADDALDVASALDRAVRAGRLGRTRHRRARTSRRSSSPTRAAGWIVETDNRTWAARPVGPGASISNRVSLATELDACVGRRRAGQRLRRSPAPEAADRPAPTSGSRAPNSASTSAPRSASPTSRARCATTAPNPTIRFRPTTRGRDSRCACTVPSSTRKRPRR